jgi:hypothetical protein
MGVYHNIIGEGNVQEANERKDPRSFVLRDFILPSLLNDPASKELLPLKIVKKKFDLIMKEEMDFRHSASTS